MKVTREAAAETRRRIVETAGKLFREKGYDGIGVADIMKEAGLTHGGFYGHFGSKDELAAEASTAALGSKTALWDIAPGESRSAALDRFLTGYLSPQHRDSPGSGCALPALGGDAARATPAVRDAFTASVRGRLERLAGMFPGRKAEQRRRAIATMTGAVGALVLARAVSDPALSEEILTAAKDALGSA